MRSALVVLVACSPRAVTPPVRTFVPDSPMLTNADVSVGGAVGGSSDIFGPHAMMLGGRARQTVQPGVALEEEGGVIAVDKSEPNSYGYTGRLGIIRAFDSSFALTAGLGGGFSGVAGGWSSADVGFIVGGTNRWVRPLLALSGGYAAPFGHRTFTADDTTLQLPRNAFARVDVGLEVGPRGAFVLGLSYLDFAELTPDVVGGNGSEGSNQSYIVVGAGARIPL